MTSILLGVALLVALLIGMNLYRVAAGPTIYDRLVAVNLIGTKSILLLVLTGSIFGRVDTFVDLAIVYALLGFVGVLAAGKYLEPRGPEAGEAPDEPDEADAPRPALSTAPGGEGQG